MKRIFLFLAATAVLASCVKDNLYDNLDGNVTIKAVASDTKTLLEDTNVLWESNDVIKVVYHTVEQSADFSVKGSVAGSTASFTGTLNPDWTLEEKVHPYAVYPATAVTLEEGTGNTVISHTLPEVQTGTVTSGMNLSSAILSEEDLAAGAAEAVFHNALTLLQVVVPEGVASVELSADYGLVGTATFYVHEKDGTSGFEDDYDEEDNPLYAGVPATGKLTLKDGGATKKSVTISSGNGTLEAKTHSVLVYPSSSNNDLTLTMTGTEGTVYTNTLNVKLLAGECRVVDLAKLFKMETESDMYISPAGGECPVTVYTSEDYTYDVVITNTVGGDWLKYTLPTKGFHKDVITFSAEENTTGEARTADVTITWGDNQTRSFQMTQQSYIPDLLNTYTESYSYEGKTHQGVLKIELSDNFLKGTYKVSGFITYTTIVGSFSYALYADYAENQLVLDGVNGTVTNGYFGPAGTVVLNVSSDFKEITMDDQKVGSADITDYSAIIVESGDDILSKIAGSYTETWGYAGGGITLSNSSGILQIDLNDGVLTIVKICGLTVSGMTVLYDEANSQLKTSGGQITTLGPADLNQITFDVVISDDSVKLTPKNASVNDTAVYLKNMYSATYAYDYVAIKQL